MSPVIHIGVLALGAYLSGFFVDKKEFVTATTIAICTILSAMGSPP